MSIFVWTWLNSSNHVQTCQILSKCLPKPWPCSGRPHRNQPFRDNPARAFVGIPTCLQFGLEPPERGYFCPFSRYPVSTNPIQFPKTTPFWAKVVSASFMASTNLPNPAKNVLLLEMWMGIWRSKNWGNPWLWVNKRSFKSSKKYEFILSALGFLTFCPFWRPGKMSGTCTWLCLFVIVDRWPIYSRREKRHFLVSRFWLRQIKSTQVNHSFIARKLKLCMIFFC